MRPGNAAVVRLAVDNTERQQHTQNNRNLFHLVSRCFSSLSSLSTGFDLHAVSIETALYTKTLAALVADGRAVGLGQQACWQAGLK
jgi:hypothetical protein